MAVPLAVWLLGHLTIALLVNDVFHNDVVFAGPEIPDLCVEQRVQNPVTTTTLWGRLLLVY